MTHVFTLVAPWMLALAVPTVSPAQEATQPAMRLVPATSVTPDDSWATWRGEWGNGAAPAGKPPLEWSEEKNVRWKVDLPGLGSSTPIVWGDRLYVTTARAKLDAEALARHPHSGGLFVVEPGVCGLPADEYGG